MTRIGGRDAAPAPGAASSFVPAGTVLGPEAFARPAEEVASMLLGCVIESELDGQLCRAQIVETEAYVGPHDEASHAHERFGPTPRNRTMFAAPGVAYVYRSYGIHWCLNVVTDREGYPAAVLIRAARPLAGAEAMAVRRGTARPLDLLRGPGRLCQALGIDGSLDGHPLDRSPLRLLAEDPVSPDRVAVGPRVGVSRAADLPLRFWLSHDPHVSAYRGGPRARSSSAQPHRTA